MRGLNVSSLRAVLFDIDGTLIDSNDFHAEAWHRALAEFGEDIAVDRVREQIGKGADNLLPALVSADFIAEHKQALQDRRGEIFERDYLDRIEPFPQVRGLFEAIKAAGMRILLASSGTSEEVAHHLDLIGCADLVEGKTSADDAGRSKPYPDIFASALARLGDVPPDQAIVVGDSPYDMQAAKALELRAIGVRCGGFTDEVLRAAGCDALYDDPADLLRSFDEAFASG